MAPAMPSPGGLIPLFSTDASGQPLLKWVKVADLLSSPVKQSKIIDLPRPPTPRCLTTDADYQGSHCDDWDQPLPFADADKERRRQMIDQAYDSLFDSPTRPVATTTATDCLLLVSPLPPTPKQRPQNPSLSTSRANPVVRTISFDNFSSTKSSSKDRKTQADPAARKKDNDHQKKRPRSPEHKDKDSRPASKRHSTHGAQSRGHRDKVTCPPARNPINSSTQQQKKVACPVTKFSTLPPPIVDLTSPAPRQKSAIRPAIHTPLSLPVKSASSRASDAPTEITKQRVAHKVSNDILQMRRPTFSFDDKKPAAKTGSTRKPLHSGIKVTKKPTKRGLDQKLRDTLRRIRKV